MHERSRRGDLDVPGLISLGFFLIILGAIFVTTPNAIGAVRSFVRDFTLVEVAGTPGWILPAPDSSHPVVYNAVKRFCFAFGSSQVIILFLRFFLRSSLSAKAKSVGDIVFWLGVSYIAGLLKTEALSWFTFWSVFIVFAGLSLIIQAMIVLVMGEKAVQ